MHPGLKLPLVLSFFLLGTSLPAMANSLDPVDPCLTVAQGLFRNDFGNHGRDGYSGRSGRAGLDGEDRTIFISTIFANGDRQSLDLSGGNGEDGEDGGDASRNTCGNQPRNVERDLQAANGGNGGSGGDGGPGGRGGNLTVYYRDLSDLRALAVNAAGGRGGQNGRGGRASVGCRCQRSSWEVETCTGSGESRECTTRRFRCRDGQNGRQGRDGRQGESGRLGQLRLINQEQPLEPDRPTVQIPISALGQTEFELSQNIWQSRRGAVALLAPGSVVADEYQEFVERVEKTVRVVWDAPQPLSRFSGETVELRLGDRQQVQISFNDSLWVQSTTTEQDGVTELVVQNIIAERDVTQLAVSNFADQGPRLNLQLVDLAGQSDILSTTFQIRYRTIDTRGRINSRDYRTRYEGTLPAAAITQDYNRFVLALGQLPIEAQYLSRGNRVEIEVIANRALGDRATTQTLTWRGEIR